MVSFSYIYVCSLKHTKIVEDVKNRIKALISNVCISLVFCYLSLSFLSSFLYRCQRLIPFPHF